jgi:hypothetical protein
LIKLLPLIVFLFFASGFLYAQDEPDSVIIIKGSRTVPVMQHDDPNNIIIIDGVVDSDPSGAEYGEPIIGHPNLTIPADSLKKDKDTVKEDAMDEKGVNINIRGNRSNENIIIVDGVSTNNPITSFDTWNISNSFGFAPKESKPVFYVTISTSNDNHWFYGLKGGVYSYEKDLDEAVNEFLQTLGPLQAGTYTISGDFATTRSLTYIGALYGSYRLSYYFLVDASFGFQYYKDDTYRGTVSFGIPTSGTPPPHGTITPDMPFYVTHSKDIVKAYYCLGMNYKIGDFTYLGIFADNIYSVGVNLLIDFK